MKTTVKLDKNHPGFHDLEYRCRRDLIAAVGENHIPGNPIQDVEYISEEDAVWEYIYSHLTLLHREFACKRYLSCRDRLHLPENSVPQLREVSENLSIHTGFTMEPVPGLVHPRIFLEALADNRMLSTQYIRHHSVPDYTPEPDVIHEILGHAIFLSDPEYADINALFGCVAHKSSDEEIDRLISLYWHTIEFGVCVEGGRVKAYGAGLLSSLGEMRMIETVPHKAFDIITMQETPYDTAHFQPQLFCAENFDQVMRELTQFLRGRLKTQ